ncbi:transglutaminase-like putative cysteine protease [Mariniflexile fucanivorans]|uniref:Transglutaminase-like putative cysteine protease n=1 Tax=Mariniflexile fucanivorans TaxID=264023 RepID=A0A4R1RII9_9FLAO|nr:transglutaminase family protein [Mariniflexile fucanivorans]TCL65462.1 transglutaminase-like putative cysteine protease [Mariniflexile fucanivorans]
MATFYIKHITKFSYSNKVIDGANLIRLYPINDDFQKVNSHFISVTNNPFVESFNDFYNNRVGTFLITEQHDELTITSDVEVVTYDKLFPEDTVDSKTQWEELKTKKYDADIIDFVKPTLFSGSEDVLALIASKNLNEKTPYKAVLELCEYVYNNFKYIVGVTNVDSTLDDVWKLKAGVCQDFTNILLQMVRMSGIPARYVSGYICPAEDNTRGLGATHAWIEAYIPFYGWFGVDPTNNAIANENHVRLAVGRNYADCSPVKGVFKRKVDSDLYVKVEISSTKNKETIVVPPNTFSDAKTNSYQRNLDRIQHQQQQQHQNQQQQQ